MNDPRRGLLGNIGVLVGGAGLGQLLVVAAYPVISRLYTAAEFGVLAVFGTILGTLVVAGSLRYEAAIPLIKSQRQALDMAALCVASSVAMLILAAAIAAIAYGLAPRVAALAEVAPFLWLLPAAFLAQATFRWLNYWLIRERKFHDVAAGSVVQAGGIVATQVGLGAAGGGPLGLLLAQLVGPVLGAAAMARRSGIRVASLASVSIPRMRVLAKRFAHFPLFGAPQVIINYLGQNLPGVLFAFLFGLDVAGFYLMAQRILKHPADMVGDAIRQAYYPRAVDAARSGALAAFSRDTTLRMTLLAFVPAVVIMAIGPQLFSWALGSAWWESGLFAAILMPFVLSGFINVPSVTVIPILGLQRFQLLVEIGVLAARCLAIGIGAVMESKIAAIALFSGAGVGANIIIIAVVLRRASAHDQSRLESPGAY